MPKLIDLTKSPNFKQRVDPTYIADDDVKAIPDDNVRLAVYRVTENLKRILLPIDARIFNDNSTALMPEFTCKPSLLITELVYLQSLGVVSTHPDNNPPEPIIGIVIARPTATKAIVKMHGFMEYPMMGQGTLYVGTRGELTLKKPTSGLVQRMGYSFGDGWIYVQPEFNR